MHMINRNIRLKTRKGVDSMLIIDENSVYEIDEECIKKRGIPAGCGVIEKIEEQKKKEQRKKDKKKK